MKATKEGGMQEPAFEEWAVEDSAAIDAAVAAYQKKQIARAELVRRVRAVADQYDDLSREAIFEDIEERLGEEVEEFWCERSARAEEGRWRA
jgi:hypothetical protein